MDLTKLRETLAALGQEEQSLVDEQKARDLRLSQIRAAKAALLPLLSDEPLEFEGGLADACRIVLMRNVGRSLAPLDVREGLKAIGYDLTQHRNEMASIHSVLKRLEESRQVKTKTKHDGSKRYFWPADQPGNVNLQGPPRPPIVVKVYPPSNSIGEVTVKKTESD